MGQAIATGLVQACAVSADRIVAFDVDSSKAACAAALGGKAASSPGELASQSDTLILAPKPQDMEAALDSIGSELSPGTLLISIAAGISIGFIQGKVGAEHRVARVMPNTPALVGAGAAAFALSESCTDADGDTAREIFESIGTAEELPESAMDAVTALSGSGPAYFFAFVEACIKGGVALGLPEPAASRLAGQTLYGAGLLLKESGESPATLRERVTSKGGTTAAALASFSESDLDGAVQAALGAAAGRSKELGL